MQALNLPQTSLNIVRKGNRLMVFDVLRRKFVTLTPEEWVRQHFVRFLSEHKGYPAARIANEVSVDINGMRKRCDTVVYAKDATPLMIIEYKAPEVQLTQSVFDQIYRYNTRLKVEWLIVSNGLQHYCCHIDYQRGECRFLDDIPLFENL